MIELPEARVLARQTLDNLYGKKVSRVVVGHSPHKYAWFHGEPDDYSQLLMGRAVDGTTAYGGLVEVSVSGSCLLFGDGVNLRVFKPGDIPAAKHQLLVEFEDGSVMTGSVQMYGGLWCYAQGEFDNPYYLVAREKPSPLSDQFTWGYFRDLLTEETTGYSAKKFLATEQRVPGLGNGVLQDILFNAGIHPRQKMGMLGEQQVEKLFHSLRITLQAMADQGGRDTEKDLLGRPGGYAVLLSSKTLGSPCPGCGGSIEKQAYMGGSVYFCPRCQPLVG